MDNLAPIAIFAYKRLDTLSILLNSLSKNKFFFNSEIFIFIDGPKNESDKLYTKSIYDFLLGFNHPNLKIIKRRSNLGLAKSIISGVSDIFENFNNVIILEDDLEVSEFFLEFMNSNLCLHENNSEIISVNAHHFISNKNYNFFHYHFSSWGWATWKNRWSKINWNTGDLLKSYNIYKDFKFNIYGTYPFKKMLKNNFLGINNSWAIRFYANSFLQNKKSIYSGVNLVANNGFDEDATHCNNDNFFQRKIGFNSRNLVIKNNLFISTMIKLEYSAVFLLSRFSRFKYFLKGVLLANDSIKK